MLRRQEICLFLAPNDESESEDRKRSVQVFHHIVEPAATRCGYQAMRVYELPGVMKGAMKVKFQYLRKVPIVVADLTGLDPNVLYESGYRRALGKPVVYLIEKKRKLPFDLYDIPPVYVDLSAPEVKNCRANLVEKIKQAQKVVPKARKIKEKVAKAKTVSP